MKMKATIVAATLVAFAGVCGVVLAGDDSAVVAKPATIDLAKSSQAAQTPAVRKFKPHRHLQEKTGISPTLAPAPTAEEKAARNKMHQHPRDAK